MGILACGICHRTCPLDYWTIPPLPIVNVRTITLQCSTSINLWHSVAPDNVQSNRKVRRVGGKKGQTSYCLKWIDRPFCLHAYELRAAVVYHSSVISVSVIMCKTTSCIIANGNYHIYNHVVQVAMRSAPITLSPWIMPEKILMTCARRLMTCFDILNNYCL